MEQLENFDQVINSQMGGNLLGSKKNSKGPDLDEIEMMGGDMFSEKAVSKLDALNKVDEGGPAPAQKQLLQQDDKIKEI